MLVAADALARILRLEDVRSATEWFRKERIWLNEQHLAVCREPAPTFFEQRRAEWIAARFRTLGWDAKIDRAGNVIAVRPGRKEKGGVAVTAHLDTVLAPRAPEDIRVAGDGRMYGPGVSDNGAGLAALLAIAAVWQAHNPMEDASSSPVLIANVGEEGEGNLSGMRYICRNGNGSRYRCFLVLDGPNADHITCRALGSRRFDITITGPGGHSWNDHGAGNPVHALGRTISLFTRRAAELEQANDARTSFNFGIIQGGTSINAIPTEARAKVDLRSETPEGLGILAGLLAAAVEQGALEENKFATGGRVTGTLKEIGSRPAGALADGEPLLDYLLAVDAHLGIRSQLTCSSTDANIPLSLGLPAVSIGVGGQGGGAHTPAEWYSPEGRETGLRRVFLLLCLLLEDSTRASETFRPASRLSPQEV
jgi:acetylornithine deacetylase/succinyl-diaminopimelate desuccinylase-like protein